MAEILYECNTCIHSEVCAYKISFMDKKDEVHRLLIKAIGVGNTHFESVGLTCKHFKCEIPRPR